MRRIFLLLFALYSVQADRRILENYERKLNDVQSSTTSGRVVKRYRCVEEYITLDDDGEPALGKTFTTSKPPRGAVVERKKKKKLHGVKTSNLEITPLKKSNKGESKSKTNDELIEEMLNKAPHKAGTAPSPIKSQIRRTPTTEEPPKQLYSHELSRGVPISQLSPPVRPYHAKNIADDYEDEEADVEYFEEIVPRRRVTYRRRPLPSLYSAEVRRPIHPYAYRAPVVRRQPRPLVRQPLQAFDHPVFVQAPMHPRPLPGPPPILAPSRVQITTQSPLLSSMMTNTIGSSIPAPNTQHSKKMEDSTPENCSKIASFAAQFGVKDASSWAKRNCPTLQMFAPGFSCEVIWHFIDSCQQKHLFH